MQNKDTAQVNERYHYRNIHWISERVHRKHHWLQGAHSARFWCSCNKHIRKHQADDIAHNHQTILGILGGKGGAKATNKHAEHICTICGLPRFWDILQTALHGCGVRERLSAQQQPANKVVAKRGQIEAHVEPRPLFNDTIHRAMHVQGGGEH